MADYINAYDENQQPIQICIRPDPAPRPVDAPFYGQILYYKDKHTGEVKEGQVVREGRFKFIFMFGENKVVKLDTSVIGRRLFRDPFSAANSGKPRVII